VDIPGALELNLLNKTVSESGKYKRFEFDLTGPPHMDLYIRPLDGVTVEDWSFIRDMLDKPEKYSPPYQIYFSYGVDKTPLKFHIDFAVGYTFRVLKTFLIITYLAEIRWKFRWTNI